MIKIEKLTYNAFGENTYLLWDNTMEGIVIDPGMSDYAERMDFKKTVETLGIKLMAIVNTHAHIDHVLGVDFVQKTYQIPFYLHALEKPILESCERAAANYGFNGYVPAVFDQELLPQNNFTFGETSLQILHVPGHAPGHVALVNTDQNICISGDVLFKQSVGRTDFPYCSLDDLIFSIQEKLYQLPDKTVVYPGHGPSTTIGFEKVNNMYVKGKR